jgi:hypothetical protein
VLFYWHIWGPTLTDKNLRSKATRPGTGSEAFEADFLKEVQEGLDTMAEKLGDAAESKDFRRLGKRMHHASWNSWKGSKMTFSGFTEVLPKLPVAPTDTGDEFKHSDFCPAD